MSGGGTPIDPAALDACVHCGFCLPACPTYTLTGNEADSPRGRVALIRALAEDRAHDERAVAHHLDRCLGCRACETACPSAVPYGGLLEQARERLAPSASRSAATRLLLSVFASPLRTRVLLTGLALARHAGLLRLAQSLPGAMGRAARIAPPAELVPHSRGATTTTDGPLGHVALLPGCVMDQGFAHVQRDTVRLLVAAGYRVSVPRGPLCCGALHAHAGDAGGAKRLVARLDAALRPLAVERLVTDAAGCRAHLGDALAVPVVDVLELLRESGAPPLPTPVAPSFGVDGRRLRVAFDPPCHLLHGSRVAGAAETLLATLVDVDLVPLADADRCCGAAGTYALEQPELAAEVRAQKLAAVRAASPDLLVTANPGCQSWLAAGLRAERSPVRVVHAVTVLARGLVALTATGRGGFSRRHEEPRF